MAEKKLQITKEGYIELTSKVFGNKEEERELALDRYRIADGEMVTAEQFLVLGKNAVSFLDLASKSSNTMAEIAKEIKSIVFKDSEGSGSVNIHLNDDFKKTVNDEILKQSKPVQEPIIEPVQKQIPKEKQEKKEDNN